MEKGWSGVRREVEKEQKESVRLMTMWWTGMLIGIRRMSTIRKRNDNENLFFFLHTFSDSRLWTKMATVASASSTSRPASTASATPSWP